MEELKAILIAHAKRYPPMQPQDAVKLIYQNEFGGGHLIRDEEACLNYLRGNMLIWRKIRQHSCMRKSETASSVSIWQRLSPKIWSSLEEILSVLQLSTPVQWIAFCKSWMFYEN